MKRILQYFILAIFSMLFICNSAFTQGIMTPGGTGAWGNMIYAGIGITTPQPYYHDDFKELSDLLDVSDMVSTLGIGLGNPVRNIGVQIGSNMLDVSEADLYNMGLKIHRYIGKGISVGIGVENLLTMGKDYFSFSPQGKSDAPICEYVAMTQDFGYLYNETQFLSRISYSIGAGLGRFSETSPWDQSENPDSKATYGFAALQFRISKNFNYHLEWSGVNLHSGISINANIGKVPLRVLLTAADLTKYTGSGIRFLGAVGVNYRFGKTKTSKHHAKDQKYDSMVKQNEMFAMMDNMKEHNQNVLNSKAELQRKVELLEEEVNKLKENQDNVSYDENRSNTSDTDFSEPGSDDIVDLNEDDIVKINKLEDGGYTIEPGNYVVIHSLVQKRWAENTADQYKKIGVNVNIAYNKDKEIHYVYTHKYPPDKRKEALLKSTEQRQKGFEGAWVFTKDEDPEGHYYQPESGMDNILDLSNDHIVNISEGDGFPIEEGAYLVVHSIKGKTNALEFAKKTSKQGIPVQVMYNHTRENHYVSKSRVDNVDVALAEQEKYKNIFPETWILVKHDSGTVHYDEPIEAVTSLSVNEIVKVDQGQTTDFYSIEPGNYVVIGSFRNVGNARNIVNVLTGEGRKAKIAFNKDLDLYYVYTDMYLDVNKALSKRDELRKEFNGAWVFSY